MVPLKGGIGSIFNHPEGKDYKWYISGIFPANWGMDYATDPTFLGEPETTIEFLNCQEKNPMHGVNTVTMLWRCVCVCLSLLNVYN